MGGVQSFDDYLLDQVSLLSISEPVARAARLVVGSLDDDGFFVGSLDEVAALAGVSRDEAEAALKAVQQLDPPGVAARDLAEALCLQMEFLGIDEPNLLRIVREHLDDVAANHFRKVARALEGRRGRGAQARRGAARAQPSAGRRVLAGSVAGLHRPRRHAAPVRRGLADHVEQRGAAHAQGLAALPVACSRAARPPMTRRDAT